MAVTTPAPKVLTPSGFEWNPDDIPGSIDRICQFTIAEANENINWYKRNIRQKRWLAQSTRVIGLFMLGLGAITPVIIDVLGLSTAPTIATLFVGIGSGLLALDRFMGYSTGWMRFSTTEMNLTAKLRKFEYDIILEKMACQNPITMENAQTIVNACRAFLDEVWSTVQEETRLWTEEFQANLRAVDENHN